MMHSKMVDKCEIIELRSSNLDLPTKDEIKILLKLLKPGKELPPLVNSLGLDDYTDQLLAEIYLDKLLKGIILYFNVENQVEELKGNTYLRFDDSLMVERVYQIICKVITPCCLDLEFENCDDKGL